MPTSPETNAPGTRPPRAIERAAELFAQALDRPAADRAAFLDAACGGNIGLRHDVESLLAHDAAVHSSAVDFLSPIVPSGAAPPAGESPGAADPGAADPGAADPLIGRRIGRYEIRAVLAAGGMGTVYEAVQDHPHRVVALKVMNQRASPAALRRFQYEAEILGRLRHPNIAQVYEAGMHIEGTANGSGASNGGPFAGCGQAAGWAIPWFAMELVPGATPLTEYADRAGLSTRQRVELFAKVCDAVHHGHQQGVIHRDLKPGNILVGTTPPPSPPSRGGGYRVAGARLESRTSVESSVESGAGEHPTSPPASGGHEGVAEPKIIDFGVARITDADLAATTQHTAVGALIGTIHYMSPEQCDGDPAGVDTRSDVYSLGVVLYELLTGRLPYDVSSGSLRTIYAATRVIREHIPQPPSTAVLSSHPSPPRERGDNDATSPERERRADDPNPERQRGASPPSPHPAVPVPPAVSVPSPPAARARARELRGNLDTIVLKALAKNRDRRYPSAAELAADLRRHLAGEPITARPPTRWERAVRWAGKRPLLATGVACAALALATLAASYLSVWFVNNRPYRLAWDASKTEVRLVSLSDRTLKVWSMDPVRQLSLGQMLLEPAEFGGRRLALIAWTGFHGCPQQALLAAYDVDGDLDKPVWTAAIHDADLPAQARQRDFRPHQFGVWKALVADVFPDRPGSEIIAAHKHADFTHAALRVYDLRGELLHETWMDVQISGLRWLAGAQRLVVVGVNGRYVLGERGVLSASRSHPLVVFALPLDGCRHPEYLVQEEPAPGEVEPPASAPRPLWYYCAIPPDWNLSFAANVEAPLTGDADSRVEFVVTVLVEYPPYGADVHWVLDASGAVRAGPYPGDDYKSNQGLPPQDRKRLAPAETWSLGPLPPVQR